jgi:hypothetical protein
MAELTEFDLQLLSSKTKAEYERKMADHGKFLKICYFHNQPFIE